jgi:MinD-like ATPase involved in chromosome partitioning or flagellar assembly
MSRIVTFYSYKGGVGRSMALANVAVLLAQRGLRVLAVDWDLEAPGLERYFSYYLNDTGGPGLLRMLMAAIEDNSVDWRRFLSLINWGPQAAHPIYLLASGREQDEDYSSNLETFDWDRFFAKGGGDFLERLREEWREAFDIVLIDSRTGLSDAGGICTIQLPDVVVAMFTANHQSLYGVRDVMRLAQKARQSLAYDRMPLAVLPLASRWGTQEFQETQVWLDRVADCVAEFYADWLPPSTITARQVVERLKVPHHSYFGFGERLAVVEQGVSDPTGLSFVYDKVAALLATGFQDLAPLLGEQAAQAATTVAGPVEVVRAAREQRGYEYDVFVSFERSSLLMEWVPHFVAMLKDRLEVLMPWQPAIFTDLHEIDLGSQWQGEIERPLLRSRVMLALITPRYFRRQSTAREFLTFLQRDQADRSVLFPVILAGHYKNFPPQVQEHHLFDMSAFLMHALPNMRSSAKFAEWAQEIGRLAELLVPMIEHAPPFDPDWTVAGDDLLQPDLAPSVPRLTPR